jgi:hypothetical protein
MENVQHNLAYKLFSCLRKHRKKLIRECFR